MSRELLVTSFSREGAEQYGYRCVQSFQEHWPQPMVVYADEPLSLLKTHGVDVRLTSEIDGWCETKRDLPTMRPFGFKPTNYIWNAQKFAVKPFVWMDAAQKFGDGVVTWVDGDTVATSPVQKGFTSGMLDGATVAYMGRGAMHPEMGYVSFKLPEALPLIRRCVSLYRNGLFTHMTDGWTDCHIFRAALQDASMEDIRHHSRDLTTRLYDGTWRSGVDAMALSPLGPYVKHLKGTKNKRTYELLKNGVVQSNTRVEVSWDA